MEAKTEVILDQIVGGISLNCSSKNCDGRPVNGLGSVVKKSRVESVQKREHPDNLLSAGGPPATEP